MKVDCIESGLGPDVVLVHSSAAGPRQWKKLSALLAPHYRVRAPHLRGYGATPAWSHARAQTLEDAAEVVLAVCAPLAGPIRLVGHSWGGAVALQVAHRLGERVSHLALYEPMLPGLLRCHGRDAAATEAMALYAELRRHVGAGDWMALGERFTDYFNGAGAWAASAPERRAAIAAALRPNLSEWDAAVAPQRLEAFHGIRAAGLLLHGSATRRVLSEVVELLQRHFGHWRVERLEGCGHMAPLAQAEVVNRVLLEFLATPVPALAAA